MNTICDKCHEHLSKQYGDQLITKDGVVCVCYECHAPNEKKTLVECDMCKEEFDEDDVTKTNFDDMTLCDNCNYKIWVTLE